MPYRNPLPRGSFLDDMPQEPLGWKKSLVLSFPIYKNHPKKEVELEYEVILRRRRGWYRGGIVRDSFKEVSEPSSI